MTERIQVSDHNNFTEDDYECVSHEPGNVTGEVEQRNGVSTAWNDENRLVDY